MMDVIKIIKLVNKGFGKVVDMLFLGRGRCWFDADYLAGSFKVGSVADFGDLVIKLSVDEVEVLYEGGLEFVEVSGNVVKFGKREYEVVVSGLLADVEDRLEGIEAVGERLNPADVLYGNGFDIGKLLGDNVASLIDSYVVKNGELFVINPVWILRGKVNYGGVAELCKGFLLVGKELSRYCDEMRLMEDRVWLKFHSGIIGVSRRIGSMGDLVENVSSKLRGFDESLLSEIFVADWVKDWDIGEDIILRVDDRGRIVGLKIEKQDLLRIEGGNKGVLEYQMSNKFVGYLLEAERGCIVADGILWLRKGDTDLYLGVMKL